VVAGISSSRLLSFATKTGLVFHARGEPDYRATGARNFTLRDAGVRATDRSAQSDLDALFETVLYFDQHPAEFASATAASHARARAEVIGQR
jgi:hypothetical protein